MPLTISSAVIVTVFNGNFEEYGAQATSSLCASICCIRVQCCTNRRRLIFGEKQMKTCHFCQVTFVTTITFSSLLSKMKYYSISRNRSNPRYKNSVISSDAFCSRFLTHPFEDASNRGMKIDLVWWAADESSRTLKDFDGTRMFTVVDAKWWRAFLVRTKSAGTKKAAVMVDFKVAPKKKDVDDPFCEFPICMQMVTWADQQVRDAQ